MLARKGLGIAVGGLATKFRALFTVDTTTVAKDYTPDIGSACAATRSIGGFNIVSSAPSAIVNATTDRLEYNANSQGPIWNTLINPALPSVITFVAGVNASAMYVNTRISAGFAAGVRYGNFIRITTGLIDIRNSALSVIGTSSPIVAAGDVIMIEDDNALDVGSIRIYVNGVLRCSNTSAATGSGSYLGFSFNSGQYIDTLEVQQ